MTTTTTTTSASTPPPSPDQPAEAVVAATLALARAELALLDERPGTTADLHAVDEGLDRYYQARRDARDEHVRRLVGQATTEDVDRARRELVTARAGLVDASLRVAFGLAGSAFVLDDQ